MHTDVALQGFVSSILKAVKGLSDRSGITFVTATEVMMCFVSHKRTTLLHCKFHGWTDKSLSIACILISSPESIFVCLLWDQGWLIYMHEL